jgi:hypothetical protein
MSQAKIRPACLTDAASLAPVHLESFHAGNGRTYPRRLSPRGRPSAIWPSGKGSSRTFPNGPRSWSPRLTSAWWALREPVPRVTRTSTLP